jgi:hypothetical protein
MSAAPARAENVVDLVDKRGSIVGAKPPLVKPGIYELLYDFDETRILSRKSTKLVVWFKIITPGEFFGVKLPRYYNVTKLEGKARRYGGFKVGWKSAFIREYAALFNSVPSRADRVPMSRFEGVEIRGRVKTVVSGWRQSTIPQPLHYSVIDALLSVPTPSPTPAPAPAPTKKYPEEG